MPKKAEFLFCQGDNRATERFLFEYQKCILLVLKQAGVLDLEQMEECIRRLEKQNAL